MSVPASSANVGPGFDAVALAVDLSFVLTDRHDPGLLSVEESHPAAVAHRRAGGEGPLWWRSPIPPGRGLGFSGSARVAGALLAEARRRGVEPADRERALAIATDLEGHPENAAASMLGGVVVATGGVAVRIDHRREIELVAWWPDTTTSTRLSRTTLPEEVPFADAVFNVGRAALLVAAFGSDRDDLFAPATEDRLHTARRLASMPSSAEVFDFLGHQDVLGRWLSGSGPTVMALCRPGDGADVASRVTSAVAGEGSVRVLRLDGGGARLDDDGGPPVVGAPEQ